VPAGNEREFTGGKTVVEHWEDAKEKCRASRERGEIEYPTGLNFLDEATGGLKKGELWIIAGKSGNGKTSLALQFIDNFTKNDKHSVLFITLEMKGWELMLRHYAAFSGQKFFDLLIGKVEIDPEIEDRFAKELAKRDYEIVEAGYNIQELAKIIKTYYANKKPDVIFIDFIQLIEWKRFKEERIAITEYIRQIKEWANKYEIAFVIVSQLRRPPSGSNYQRDPDIVDLKGTGALEQMADKVILIYRKDTINEKDEIVESKHYIHLAKNRQGRMIKKEVFFKGDIYRFFDLDSREAKPEGVDKVVSEFGGEVV